MPVSIQQLQPHPVVLVTIDGPFNAAMADAAFRDVAEVTRNIDGTVYRVTDFRAMEVTFTDMVQIVKALMGGAAGSPSDPRIQNLFVGTGPMVTMARESLANRGVEVPLFATVEDALEAVEIGFLGG